MLATLALSNSACAKKSDQKSKPAQASVKPKQVLPHEIAAALKAAASLEIISINFRSFSSTKKKLV